MVIQDMPSMSPRVPLPNADQQAEFERQLDILINEHLSYTSIVTWVSRPHSRIDIGHELTFCPDHLQRRLGPDQDTPVPRVRHRRAHQVHRRQQADRRDIGLVRPRRGRLLRQPQVREPPVRRALLLDPVVTVRQQPNRHPGRVRRYRPQRLHREVSFCLRTPSL